MARAISELRQASIKNHVQTVELVTLRKKDGSLGISIITQNFSHI
jgi:hypothetical protein